MNVIGRLLVSVWALFWGSCWVSLISTVYLLGALFARSAGWTDSVQRLFARGLLACAMVRVRVSGRENIPADPCVLMANHRSYLDIPAMISALSQIFVLFVAKRELTRIPIFGWALAASYHIKVDRGDREQAIRALQESVRKIGAGIGLAVFPEGTRSPDDRLLRLKKGGFYVSVDTGFSILPISIRNSGRLWGKRSRLLQPGIIEVVVHPPIVNRGRSREDIPEIMRKTRSAILSGLPEAVRLEEEAAVGDPPADGAVPGKEGSA